MEERGKQWKEALKGESCPSLDALMDALAEEGPLPPEVERHLATCPRCETEVAMYRDFERAEVETGKEEDLSWVMRRLEASSPVPGPPAAQVDQPESGSGPLGRLLGWLTGAGWRPLAPVGAALLAAALLLLVWKPGLGEIGEIGDPLVTRSSGIQLTTAPLSNLSEPPQSLSWNAPKEAAKFVVHVYEVDRTELWRGESERSSIDLPESIRSQMSVGRRFFWQVEAYSAEGRPLGTSEMADFAIRNPSNSPERGNQ